MNTSFPTLDNPSLIPPKDLSKNVRSDGINRENSRRNNKEARIEKMERNKEGRKAKALSKASYSLNSNILQELIDNNVDKTLNLLEQFFQSSDTDELMRKNLRGIINILNGKKELCIRAIEKVEKIQNFDYDTDTSGSFFNIDTFLRYEDPEPIRLGKIRDEPDKYKSFMVICDLFGITAEQCLGTSQYELVLDDFGASYGGNTSEILVYKGLDALSVPIISDIKTGEKVSLKYYLDLKFNSHIVNDNVLQFMESQSDVIKYWVLLGWLNKQFSHSSSSSSPNKQKGGDKKFDKHGDGKKRGDRSDSKKKEMPQVTGPPINLSDIIRNGSSFKTNPLYSLLSQSEQLNKKPVKKDKKGKKGGGSENKNPQVGGKDGKSGKDKNKGKGDGGEKKKNYDLNNNIENFSKFMMPCEDSYIRVGKYIDRNIYHNFNEQMKLTAITTIRQILNNPLVVYYLSYLDAHDSGASSSDRKLFNRYMIKSLEKMDTCCYTKKGEIDKYESDVVVNGKTIHKAGDIKKRKVVGDYNSTFRDKDEINNLNERHFISIFKFLMTENEFDNIALYFPDENKADNYLFRKNNEKGEDDTISNGIDITIKRMVSALIKLIDLSVVNMVGITTRIYKDAYDGSILIKKNMFGDLIGNGVIKNQLVPNLLGYYSYTYQRFDTFETELRERYREILEPPKKDVPENKRPDEKNRNKDSERDRDYNQRKERRNRNYKKDRNQENREPIYKNKSKTEKTFENKRETRNRQANVIAKRNGSRQNNDERGKSHNEKKYFIDKTQSPYTRALKMISKLEEMNSKNRKISYFRRFKENDPKAFEEFKKNKILIQSLKNII